MRLSECLDELQRKALADPALKEKFLATRAAQDPLGAFCRLCQEQGYPVYEMDLIGEGESFYAEIRRSTNGGGENSPLLTGEDDFYEMFFAGLKLRGRS